MDEHVKNAVYTAILLEGASMAITKENLDELLKDYKGPDDITGHGGLIKQLTSAVIEMSMQAEMTEQLGYE